MSHVQCPRCKSKEHTSGYGLAAGPFGSYTFCDKCNYLIEFSPDTGGLPEEDVVRLEKLRRPAAGAK